jgi:transposase
MTREELLELVQKKTAVIIKQEETIKKLEARIVELEAVIAHLQKDSRNSSKPPSSDIVKPKTSAQKESGNKNRRIGGQAGHKKHERKPFPPEQVDEVIEATLEQCPECGNELNDPEGKISITQQIEIVEKPFKVTEYHQHSYWCPVCKKHHTAPLPQKARSGLFSIHLIALVAYLKGRCHVSFSALKDMFQDVLHITVSCGFLVKQVMKASKALKGSYEKLAGRLATERHLHIDETGWKEKGEKRWIWAFRGGTYAVFVIKDTRAESVLEEILGNMYSGIISCDYYGAYRKFKRLTPAILQFCWAHLIREILFLLELSDEAVVRYGKRIMKEVRSMFETIHEKGEIEEGEWKGRMKEHQELIMKRATGTVPENREAKLIEKRLRDWEGEYFGFIEHDIVPTNNPAELTVRLAVLDRMVTQGSRSKKGNEWHERFWTILEPVRSFV